ncbi:unnamed protein product, partial [Rangifer tarandus platyrhynchus]
HHRQQKSLKWCAVCTLKNDTAWPTLGAVSGQRQQPSSPCAGKWDMRGGTPSGKDVDPRLAGGQGSASSVELCAETGVRVSGGDMS